MVTMLYNFFLVLCRQQASKPASQLQGGLDRIAIVQITENCFGTSFGLQFVHKWNFEGKKSRLKCTVKPHM